mmetsp:Transcript_9795/g.21228  ORF Transcript_9795/g.21228 Transcript_9795/m.21228 type:complete len:130 (-) Transcript_9795:2059-2448(-)
MKAPIIADMMDKNVGKKKFVKINPQNTKEEKKMKILDAIVPQNIAGKINEAPSTSRLKLRKSPSWRDPIVPYRNSKMVRTEEGRYLKESVMALNIDKNTAIAIGVMIRQRSGIMSSNSSSCKITMTIPL